MSREASCLQLPLILRHHARATLHQSSYTALQHTHISRLYHLSSPLVVEDGPLTVFQHRIQTTALS
jgi:hypothetical protein